MTSLPKDVNFYQAFYQTHFSFLPTVTTTLFATSFSCLHKTESPAHYSPRSSGHWGYLISDSAKMYRKSLQLTAVKHLDLISVM